ncbi:MAG: ketoacyl-ACP synthase III [Spirochaetales bacterium]|nr:ketoacyl-ACP synthase III [Spirochaetales bacterium]
MAYCRIRGTGIYAPGEPITNEELMTLASINFDSDRHREKLGISRRHIAKLRGLPETTADFAEKAARSALAQGGVEPKDVQLIVVATDTPEYISPATSILVQGRLMGEQAQCSTFDINATCAGFSTAFDTVNRILAADPGVTNALVIGVYNMPAFVRDRDTFGYSIFADGAGAFLLGRCEDHDESRYIQGYSVTDGTQWDYVGIYTGGTRQPITKERLETEDYGLQLLKRLPGDRNVKLWPTVIQGLVNRAGLRIDDVDHFLFTQINKTVIEEVMAIIGQPMSKTTTIMEDFGYTGSGCIPMAFHVGVQRKAIKRGDRVCMVASGAGLAVASNVFVY